MKRILVYGFKPFLGASENITEQIVGGLPRRLGAAVLEGEVLDVRFSRAMLVAILNRRAPDIVLGLGQTTRGRRLQIERTARNLRCAARGGRVREIRHGGVERRSVNLKLPQRDCSVLSYNAGSYVCNFSMYIMCEEAEARGFKFGFVHVPAALGAARAGRQIRSLLAELGRCCD